MTATEWSDVFEEFRPGVWETKPDQWPLVDTASVRDLALDEDLLRRPMAGDLLAYVILDGGVVYVEKEDPDAWDDDVLNDGIWVVGDEAFRAVCDALSLAPPPRPDPQGPTRDARRRKAWTPSEQAHALGTWSGIASLLGDAS